MGPVVRGIRRGAGRMLGMEIQALAGEEGGKPERGGNPRVWGLGGKGREIRVKGPGGLAGARLRPDARCVPALPSH